MDKMSKKLYRISSKVTQTVENAEKTKGENQVEYKIALKGIFSTVLLVFAAVFGGLISTLSMGAAFLVVFAYICTQLAIWLS